MSKRPNNYVPAGRLKGWVGVVDKWMIGLLDCWIAGKHRRGPVGLVALVFIFLTVPQLGVAQQLPTPPPKSSFDQFMEQDYLFGTWGGLRTKLSEHGVDFEFFYIASNPHNISGGIATASRYQGAFLMLLDLDSQKLVGYEGGHFHVGGVSIHGQDHFSDQFIGDLNKVNLIDFPQTWRLWEMWYEQQFWSNRVSLKFGQMAIDQDFLVAEYYNSLASINLMNQTFFYPTLAFNIYNIPGFPGPLHALASSPYGAPGVRLKVNATDQIYVQGGVYDGYPNQENGTVVKLNADQGALAYGEIGYRLNQRKEDTGPPGNLKFGGFYDTGKYPDLVSVFKAQLGKGAPSFHINTYGFYFLADQTLFREIGKDDPAQQGLVGFFRLTGAPADRNLTQFGVDGGLVYKGLIPTRDWDTIAVAASYLEMSHDFKHGQELINSAAPGTFPELADYEAAVEISYKAQITAWLTLHASIERAIHPGGHTLPGNANPQDAWAFILAATLRL
jgi:porin